MSCTPAPARPSPRRSLGRRAARRQSSRRKMRTQRERGLSFRRRAALRSRRMSPYAPDEADAFEAAAAAAVRPRDGRAAGALPRRAQPGAARGGRGARRAGADAGRRRHRQDQGADRADRAYPAHGPGAAERDPRRHLHQQGRARDEAPRRPAASASAVEGMPWLGTFHSLSTQHPAPPRRTGRAEVELHHPRHRRPAAAAEAADPGRGHRRQALAAAAARQPDRRLEEPRPVARAACPPRTPAPSTTRATELYAAYQERLRDAERLRLRRPAAARASTIFQTHPDVLAQYQRWFRYILVDEYQDTNVAQYLWLRLLARRRIATSAASATTTSRSTAGAAPRSATSCASRRTFPARR